jgi:3-methyl-2-oxobutanoate hydroxymethyltransferase
VIEGAIRAYAEDVRSRAFPTPEHTYPMQGEGKAQPVRARERVGADSARATKKPKNPSSK